VLGSPANAADGSRPGNATTADKRDLGCCLRRRTKNAPQGSDGSFWNLGSISKTHHVLVALRIDRRDLALREGVVEPHCRYPCMRHAEARTQLFSVDQQRQLQTARVSITRHVGDSLDGLHAPWATSGAHFCKRSRSVLVQGVLIIGIAFGRPPGADILPRANMNRLIYARKLSPDFCGRAIDDECRRSYPPRSAVGLRADEHEGHHWFEKGAEN